MANADGVMTSDLVTLVRDWQARPHDRVTCPACTAGSLAILDQSARPYREWYAVSCAACGFEKTVGISMGAMGG